MRVPITPSTSYAAAGASAVAAAVVPPTSSGTTPVSAPILATSSSVLVAPAYSPLLQWLTARTMAAPITGPQVSVPAW